METTKSNFLRTTVLNTDVTENKGKEHLVLPMLRDALLRFHPELADEADELLRKNGEVTVSGSIVTVTVNNNNDNSHDNRHYSDGYDNADDNDSSGVENDGNIPNTTITLQENIAKLSIKWITCSNATW